MNRLLYACLALGLSLPSISMAAGPSLPMDVPEIPAGIRIEIADEGAVFANAEGLTLYKKGECTSTVYKIGRRNDEGFDYQLPHQDKRESCLDKYKPAKVPDGAKPVGQWTIVERKDGIRQWAFAGAPLYASVKDSRPGETNDVQPGNTINTGGAPPAYVPLNSPAGFALMRYSVGGGAYLATLTEDSGNNQLTVYAYDRDTATQSNCNGECVKTWKPVIAPALVKPSHDWTIVKRSDGRSQWAFLGKPLYTYVGDEANSQQRGEGLAHWKVLDVYPRVGYPAGYASVVAVQGHRVIDENQRTVYWFQCREGGPDNLDCEDPGDQDSVWYVVCDGYNADSCAKQWFPVKAAANAKPVGHSWTVMTIPDPTKNWSPARPPNGADIKDGIKVWAFKGKPLFHYYRDKEVGDYYGWDVMLHPFVIWLTIGSIM